MDIFNAFHFDSFKAHARPKCLRPFDVSAALFHGQPSPLVPRQKARHPDFGGPTQTRNCFAFRRINEFIQLNLI